MDCIILLPNIAGRLPTAEELRQRGFVVSAAVLLSGSALAEGGEAMDHAPALAAEAHAPYGGQGRMEG